MNESKVEARDFRIGNKVNWIRKDQNLPDEIVEVYSITRSAVRVYTEIEELDEVLIYFDSISGIPLTEYWLLKFGFEKRDSIHYYNESFHIAFDNDRFWFMGVNYKVGGIELQSVHQLQNLFFSLTGQELTFK